MNKRLLDRFQLAGVQIVSRSLDYDPDSDLSGPVTVDVTFKRQLALREAKGEDARSSSFVLDGTLSVVASRSDDSKSIGFSAAVRLRASFVAPVGDEVGMVDLNEQAHQVSRFVFPLVRIELFRLLAGARIQDTGIPWDLGIDGPDEQSSDDSAGAQ